MIIAQIQEKFVKTGAVKMAFVQEESVIVYLDILGKIVRRLYVLQINIITLQIIHVVHHVLPELIKMYFQKLVFLVI